MAQQIIRKYRQQWFGHCQQTGMDCTPKKLYHWKPVHGKWDLAGRPKTSWREVIQKDISNMDLGWTVEEVEGASKGGADYVEATLELGSKCSNERCCSGSK